MKKGFCAFIGDEVTAAGFRLAGARVLTPEQETLAATFAELVADYELVLVTAEFAARLPDRQVRLAQLGGAALVLVIPDVRGDRQPEDLRHAVRRQLGLSE
jgi:vacuolar-type H+-ATPase subunit F/Vma7